MSQHTSHAKAPNPFLIALEARAPAFAEAMIAENGATFGFAMFNVELAAGVLREAAAITTRITGEVIPSDKPGCIAMALKEPVGVILGIAPWNGPIVLGVRAIAVPLACGNTVILKASETCPRTHELIYEAFLEAGFPEGVVNLVTNAPADAGEVVGALIDAPEVKRINFTGSTEKGRIVARRESALTPAREQYLRLMLADVDGGDQESALRRRPRPGRRGEWSCREAHARIHGPPRPDRGHHRVLREAAAEFPCVTRALKG